MSSQNRPPETDRIEALAKLSEAAGAGSGSKRPRKLFPVLLLCVFFVAMLLALIAGVSVYRHISDTQAGNVARREGAELIANIVHANDAKGAIATGEGPEGKSLVVVESLDSGTYETRIYLYKGKVVEEYSLQGTGYTPAKASTVTESESFDFSYSNGLLSVSTDQGTCEVALRYLQGGE